MLGLLNCQHHQTPINIIVSRMDNYTAFCEICFQILQKQQEINKAVRLNTHTLNIFELFTTYVFEKLHQWVQKVKQNDANSIFEEVNQNHNSYIPYKNTLISRKIAEEVIQDYRLLIKGNKDSVISQKIPQILYHHQFLKDIYNLVTKNWKVSANMISSNYSQKLKQSTFVQRQFKIKSQLIEQIDNERMKIVGESLEFVIVKIHPLLEEMNRGNNNEGEQIKYSHQNQSNDINQLQKIESPVLIKKIESFQEVKSYNNSSKIIEQRIQQTNLNRVKNMKKTKLIDQKEYSETSNNYLALLKKLDVLKLENDNLRQQNYSLKSQNIILSAENKAFKSQYQKNRVKMNNLTLNYKHPLPGYFSQLKSQNYQSDIQIDNKHDLRLLIQYVRNLEKSRDFDENLHKMIISQLKTVQIKL